MSTSACRLDGAYQTSIEYLLEGEHSGVPPQWIGKGARALFLTGEAPPKHFWPLLQGLHPFTGWKLVQNAGSATKHPGVHLVVAPDKTFDALLASLPPGAWGVLIDCHRQAVLKGLEAISEQITGRFGPGGRYHLAAELIVRETVHLLSRAKDPLVHSHLDVVGVVYCPANGRTYALQSKQVYDAQRLLEASYQLELGNGLMRLGYAVEQRNGVAVVRDVPQTLCRALSSRSEQIAAYARKFGLDTPAVRKLAAILTRPEKRVVDPRSLSARWQQLARSHGFSPESIRPKATIEKQLATPFGRHAEVLKLAVRAADELAAEKGQVAARDWSVRTAQLCVGRGVSYSEVQRGFERVLSKPKLFGVTVVPRVGQEPLYTTAAAKPYWARLANAVKSALSSDDSTAGRFGAAVAARVRHLGEAGQKLGASVARNRIVVAVGGTGKVVIDAAKEVWSEFRHPITRVRADKPAGHSQSLARLLSDLRPLSRQRAHVEAVKAVVRRPLTSYRNVDDILRVMEAAYRRARRPKVELHRRSVVVVEKSAGATPEQVRELNRRVARAKARVAWVAEANVPNAAVIELARRVSRQNPPKPRPAPQPSQEPAR